MMTAINVNDPWPTGGRHRICTPVGGADLDASPSAALKWPASISAKDCEHCCQH